MIDVLTRSTRLRLAALVLGTLTAASCERLMATKIAKIAAEPGKYQGKNVTVVGTVQERINLRSIKCYILSDGGGSIGVVTEGPLPSVGKKMLAKGRVQQSFAIGNRQLVVIIEPHRPTPTPARIPASRRPGPA